MKKYIKQKTTAVVLDPDQVILNVCRIGGVYFTRPITPVCVEAGASTNSCMTAVRGVRIFGTRWMGSPDSFDAKGS